MKSINNIPIEIMILIFQYNTDQHHNNSNYLVNKYWNYAESVSRCKFCSGRYRIIKNRLMCYNCRHLFRPCKPRINITQIPDIHTTRLPSIMFKYNLCRVNNKWKWICTVDRDSYTISETISEYIQH